MTIDQKNPSPEDMRTHESVETPQEEVFHFLQLGDLRAARESIKKHSLPPDLLLLQEAKGRAVSHIGTFFLNMRDEYLTDGEIDRMRELGAAVGMSPEEFRAKGLSMLVRTLKNAVQEYEKYPFIYNTAKLIQEALLMTKEEIRGIVEDSEVRNTVIELVKKRLNDDSLVALTIFENYFPDQNLSQFFSGDELKLLQSQKESNDQAVN